MGEELCEHGIRAGLSRAHVIIKIVTGHRGFDNLDLKEIVDKLDDRPEHLPCEYFIFAFMCLVRTCYLSHAAKRCP